MVSRISTGYKAETTWQRDEQAFGHDSREPRSEAASPRVRRTGKVKTSQRRAGRERREIKQYFYHLLCSPRLHFTPHAFACSAAVPPPQHRWLLWQQSFGSCCNETRLGGGRIFDSFHVGFFVSARRPIAFEKSVKTALDKVDKAIFDLDFLMLSGF